MKKRPAKAEEAHKMVTAHYDEAGISVMPAGVFANGAFLLEEREEKGMRTASWRNRYNTPAQVFRVLNLKECCVHGMATFHDRLPSAVRCLGPNHVLDSAA